MKNTVNKTNFIFWIAAAVMLRVVAMLVAAHSDITFINFFPSKLAYEGIFNIYGYIEANFPPDRTWAYYPPMTYLTVGGWQFLFKAFCPGFYQWISKAYFLGLGEWLVVNGASFDFFKYLFMMKLPYLFFDMTCLYAILGCVNDSDMKKRALKLWVFSPVILYGVYMFGQVDIFPVTLIMISILMVKRKKKYAAFLLLSLSGLFKTFPLFLILPYLIILTDSRASFWKNITAVSLPFILILLPFYLFSGSQVINSLFPRFYVVPAEYMFLDVIKKIIFVMLYGSLLISCYKMKRALIQSDAVLLVSIAVLMIIFTLFFTPIHYFVWVTPLLILAVSMKMIPGWIFWAQIICLFIYNLNSSRTTGALFMPLNPQFFTALPGLPDLIHGFSIRWGAVMLGARMMFTVFCVGVAGAVINKKYFLAHFYRIEEK